MRSDADDVTAAAAKRVRAFVAGRPETEQLLAARDFTVATRRVIDRFMAKTMSAETLRAAAAQMTALADEFEQFPASRTYDYGESSIAGDPAAFFDVSPVAGSANPLAPPMRMRIENGEVIGEVRLGNAYEGAPGCSHGGFVLAHFDEVLGFAQDLGGQPGMTGTLTTKFRKPTPLHVDLRYVGRLVRVEGRKTFTAGESYDPDGNLLAEAEAVFITVDFRKLEALAGERQRGEAE